MPETPQDKPEFIIDEDWKSKVEREREALKQGADQPAESAEPPEDSIPPASFSLLVTTLATQALIASGQVTDEEGKPLPSNPAMARHYVDILAMLEEKTKGNLTAEESALIDQVLHELRMIVVTLASRPPKAE